MAVAQQEHGLLLELFGRDTAARSQRVIAGYSGYKRLVVQRRDRQVGIGKRLGQNRTVDLAGTQLLQQLDSEIFLQHQGHLRAERDVLAHQVGQQVGADGVDDAQAQCAGQRVFAALGDLADAVGLLQHALRLAHDLQPQRRDGDLVGVALEQLDLQFFLELLDRHAQRGLRHMAGLGAAAEMFFAGHGHDVFEFGEGHVLIVLLCRSSLQVVGFAAQPTQNVALRQGVVPIQHQRRALTRPGQQLDVGRQVGKTQQGRARLPRT